MGYIRETAFRWMRLFGNGDSPLGAEARQRANVLMLNTALRERVQSKTVERDKTLQVRVISISPGYPVCHIDRVRRRKEARVGEVFEVLNSKGETVVYLIRCIETYSYLDSAEYAAQSGMRFGEVWWGYHLPGTDRWGMMRRFERKKIIRHALRPPQWM